MNKTRLIDANALLRHLSDWWLSETPSGEVTVINDKLQKTPTNEIIEECIKAVEEQPTAYDTDEVIKELINNTQECTDRITYETHSFVPLFDAIKIVKGGVE